MKVLNGEKRTVDNLVRRVRAAWGVTPVVHQRRREDEVWLCFTKEFKIRDCGGIKVQNFDIEKELKDNFTY